MVSLDLPICRNSYNCKDKSVLSLGKNISTWRSKRKRRQVFKVILQKMIQRWDCIMDLSFTGIESSSDDLVSHAFGSCLQFPYGWFSRFTTASDGNTRNHSQDLPHCEEIQPLGNWLAIQSVGCVFCCLLWYFLWFDWPVLLCLSKQAANPCLEESVWFSSLQTCQCSDFCIPVSSPYLPVMQNLHIKYSLALQEILCCCLALCTQQLPSLLK